MNKQEEIREPLKEILASCLSANDVRPRADEVFELFHSKIVGWLIVRRQKLQERKERHIALKPHDVQGAMLYGIKARALQEVINYLNSLLEISNGN